jgi:hypothetical protein
VSELQPLQQLSFDAPPRLVSTIGDKGEMAFIPLEYLFVDPAYQRAILKTGKANIRRMVEEFSWERFGACVVARRGKDRYAIIDGQHRATAALNRGLEAVPCLILKGARDAEARAFNAINANVTRVQPLQIFRAAVAGGDTDAVALVAACAEAGVTIAPHSTTEYFKAGETMALAAMRKCLQREGRETLITALIVLRAADPQAALHAVAVAALCALAAKHPEWNKDAARIGGYVARLGKSLAQMNIDAQQRKMLRGGTNITAFTAIFEQAVAAGQRAADPRLAKMMAGR